ncbi:alanine racemase [Kribbella deserti]|uniref:Alanine racemase n=1 Tax=Kribbella deserti TaxID=1926257 RepID=A0ABV6QWE2_9ACTN
MNSSNHPALRAEAVVDLGAIRHNVATLRAVAAGAQLMTVVKADAYGHGLLPVARAAREAGADWIGAAVIEEALALRAGGDTGRIFCWLTAPGEDLTAAVAAGIDLSASAPWGIDELGAAARTTGTIARVHLKIDTGMGRAGATPEDWPELVRVAQAAEAAGLIEIAGIWSHLAMADDPKNRVNDQQLEIFQAAVDDAGALGVRPPFRHIANSGGTLRLPASHFDLVRPGLATYGLSPFGRAITSAELGLRPAMTLRARLSVVKRVPAGTGISYGHTYVTPVPTTIGLLPLGYGDGVPRHASGTGPVWVAGERRSIVGRVCMDQSLIDLGDDPVQPGEDVVLFGPGDRGEPTVDDWADAAQTINYEIVTRLGARVPRTYVELDRTGGATG